MKNCILSLLIVLISSTYIFADEPLKPHTLIPGFLNNMKVKQLHKSKYDVEFESDLSIWYGLQEKDSFEPATGVQTWWDAFTKPDLIEPQTGVVNITPPKKTGPISLTPGTHYVLYNNDSKRWGDAPELMNFISLISAILEGTVGSNLGAKKIPDHVKKLNDAATAFNDYKEKINQWFYAVSFGVNTACDLYNEVWHEELGSTEIDQFCSSTKANIEHIVKLIDSTVSTLPPPKVDFAENSEVYNAIKEIISSFRKTGKISSFKSILPQLKQEVAIALPAFGIETTIKSCITGGDKLIYNASIVNGNPYRKTAAWHLRAISNYFIIKSTLKHDHPDYSGKKFLTELAKRLQPLAKEDTVYQNTSYPKNKTYIDKRNRSSDYEVYLSAGVQSLKTNYLRELLKSPDAASQFKKCANTQVTRLADLTNYLKFIIEFEKLLVKLKDKTLDVNQTDINDFVLLLIKEASKITNKQLAALVFNLAKSMTPAKVFKIASAGNKVSGMAWDWVTKPSRVDFITREDNGQLSFEEAIPPLEHVRYLAIINETGYQGDDYFLDAVENESLGVQKFVNGNGKWNLRDEYGEILKDKDGNFTSERAYAYTLSNNPEYNNFLLMGGSPGAKLSVENKAGILAKNAERVRTFFESGKKKTVIADWHAYRYMSQEDLPSYLPRDATTAFGKTSIDTIDGSNFNCTPNNEVDLRFCKEDTKFYQTYAYVEGDAAESADNPVLRNYVDYLAKEGICNADEKECNVINFIDFTKIYLSKHVGTLQHNTPGIYLDSTKLKIKAGKLESDYDTAFTAYVMTDYDYYTDNAKSHRSVLLDNSKLLLDKNNQPVGLDLKIFRQNYFNYWGKNDQGFPEHSVSYYRNKKGEYVYSPFFIYYEVKESTGKTHWVGPIKTLELSKGKSVYVPLPTASSMSIGRIFVYDNILKSYMDASGRLEHQLLTTNKISNRKEFIKDKGMVFARPVMAFNLDNLTKTALSPKIFPDMDSDGVPDEIDLWSNNDKYSFDSDHDGLADAWEVSNGYNPLEPDSTDESIEAFMKEILSGFDWLKDISVTPSQPEVAATEGTVTLDVTTTGTETINWTVSEDADWFTVSPTSGTNDGTVTVSYEANSGDERTGTITFSVDGTNSSKTVEVQQSGNSAGFLHPLTGSTYYITSYFDHSMSTRYQGNGTMTIYDGRTGSSQSSGSCYTVPLSKKKNLYCYRSETDNKCLCYDDHPGTDFGTDLKPAEVKAVADGVIKYAGCPTSSRCGGCNYNGVLAPGANNHNGTIEIFHEDSGLTTCYLHLSDITDSIVQKIKAGKPVTVKRGDTIGKVGDIGAPGQIHLHFEVRNQANQSIDPYGWQGAGDDPYTPTNGSLWGDGAIPPSLPPIMIPELTLGSIDRANGDIFLKAINGTSFGSSGKVTVDGKTAEVEWSEQRLNVKGVYDINELITPIHIQIYDEYNRKTADTYYPFMDVATEMWYAKPVVTLWKSNILSEQEDGKFSPDRQPPKKEFIAALMRAVSEHESTGWQYPSFAGIFDDVNKDDWFAKYAEYAYTSPSPDEYQIITSCKANSLSFCPSDLVSRAGAAQMTMSAFSYNPTLRSILADYTGGIAGNQEKEIPVNLFSDVVDETAWYYPYVYAAQEVGVVQGSEEGTFDPERSISRAEMAKMICIAAYGLEECLEVGDIIVDVDYKEKTALLSAADPTITFNKAGLLKLDAVQQKKNTEGVDWYDKGIEFDLSKIDKLSPEGLEKPVFVEIVERQSNTYLTGYYPYTDIADPDLELWYTAPVLQLWKLGGIMKGYPHTGLFKPNHSITREEYLVSVVRAIRYGEEQPPATAQVFNDVSMNRWSAGYVQYAKENGLVRGCNAEGTEFCPESPITRAEAVKIAILALRKDTHDKLVQGEITPVEVFSDVEYDDWFYHYIQAATLLNIIDGYDDNTFRPNDLLSRGAAAKIICGAAFDPEKCKQIGGISLPTYPDILSTDFNQQTGQLTFILAEGSALPGKALLDGQDISIDWDVENSSLTFNLYEITGGETLWEPVDLKITDAYGREIYSGCFPFKDVCAGDWYTRPVMKLWQEGIIEGYKDGTSGTFGGGNDSSRAEAIKMTVSVLESGNTLSEVTTPPFADVPADEWYAKYIAYVKEKGWVQGCDPANNLFCPGDPINRVEAAKIVSLGLQPGLLEEMNNNRQPEWLFSDVQDAEEWYYPYVYTLQAAHAVHGTPYDNLYRPADPTKREELAKMVCVAAFGETECTDMDRPDAQ